MYRDTVVLRLRHNALWDGQDDDSRCSCGKLSGTHSDGRAD